MKENKQFKRLKDLREDKDLTQEKIATILGLHRTQYQRYETGESPLTLELAIEIAKFYNVSLEYLAGIEDVIKKL